MSAWSQPVEICPDLRFSRADFRETLDGGQAFTWREIPYKINFDEAYEGFFGHTAAKIYLTKNGEVFASFAEGVPVKQGVKLLAKYLDCERDYSAVKKSLPLAADKIMAAAAAERPTLRILRQTPQEAVVSFICSSSKRIVQIKQCVRLLADKLGEPICPGFKSLPTFEAINEASLETVKECKLGFRAQYLKKSAKKILEDKFEISALPEMPYDEAKKYLLTLSGVGEKVADCILLFGAAKFDAFPVDTWIKKAMCQMYNLSDPSEIRRFALSHFGRNGGYAQQLIFARIRNERK